MKGKIWGVILFLAAIVMLGHGHWIVAVILGVIGYLCWSDEPAQMSEEERKIRERAQRDADYQEIYDDEYRKHAYNTRKNRFK